MVKKKSNKKNRTRKTKNQGFELNQISIVAIVGLVVVALAFMTTINPNRDDLYGYASQVTSHGQIVPEIALVEGISEGDILSGIVNIEVKTRGVASSNSEKVAFGVLNEETGRMIEWGTWITEKPFSFDSRYDHPDVKGWDTSYVPFNGKYSLWVYYYVNDRVADFQKINFEIRNKVVDESSFDLPEAYEIGSKENIGLILDLNDKLKAKRVVFHAFNSKWERIENSGMQDTSHPYEYSSSALDYLPEGKIYVQAMLYDVKNTRFHKVTETLTVSSPTPDPIKNSCGNGLLDNIEYCDSDSRSCVTEEGYVGNQVCDEYCNGYEVCITSELCGDAILNGDEECDDGNLNNYDSCSNECTVVEEKSDSSDFITLEAENGELDGFIVENGAIYQTVKRLEVDGTNPTARYTFSVDKAGEYQVLGSVKAVDGDSDSFFVDINQAPTGTNSIWDIPDSSDFTQQRVTWREDSDVLFYLTPGTHTLYVTAREANAYADKWYIKLDGAVICGDGHVSGNEVCEPGQVQSCGIDGTQTCNSQCSGYGACQGEIIPVCGNNVREGSEQCDDGDLDNGDGCSSTCKAELSDNACNDGEDNDNDGGYDYGGIDTDGDGFVDLPPDKGCYGPFDQSEAALSPDQEDGWITFDLHPDAKIVYVSSSRGNDNNDGLSPKRPVKTLQAGYDKIESRKGDWLLLRGGDSFYDPTLKLTKSGKDENHKMLIGVYGKGPRPKLNPGHDQLAFDANRQNGLKHLAIVGMHLPYDDRDPASPSFVGAPGGDHMTGILFRLNSNENQEMEDLLVMDTVVEHQDTGIRVVDDYSRELKGDDGKSMPPGYPGRINIHLHRNIIRYSAAIDKKDSHSIGKYIEGTINSKITQNTLDHNGWTKTQNALGGAMARNKKSHNIYAQQFNSPLYFAENLFLRGASHGLQVRAGGDVICNIFAENAYGLYFAIRKGDVTYNVVTETTDKIPFLPAGNENPDKDYKLGKGLGVYPPKSNIQHNYFSYMGGTLFSNAFALEASSRSTIENNYFHDWDLSGRDGPMLVGGTYGTHGSTELPNYDRTLAKYAKSIGLAESNEAFYEAVGNRPRGVWPEELAASALYRYFSLGNECPTLSLS